LVGVCAKRFFGAKYLRIFLVENSRFFDMEQIGKSLQGNVLSVSCWIKWGEGEGVPKMFDCVGLTFSNLK
jgi:hypothetical protein